MTGGHCSQRLDDGWVPGVEILIVARPKVDTSGTLDRLGAKAVELQFVHPQTALRQLRGGLQEHGLDEAGFGLEVGTQGNQFAANRWAGGVSSRYRYLTLPEPSTYVRPLSC